MAPRPEAPLPTNPTAVTALTRLPLRHREIARCGAKRHFNGREDQSPAPGLQRPSACGLDAAQRESAAKGAGKRLRYLDTESEAAEIRPTLPIIGVHRAPPAGGAGRRRYV